MAVQAIVLLNPSFRKMLCTEVILISQYLYRYHEENLPAVHYFINSANHPRIYLRASFLRMGKYRLFLCWRRRFNACFFVAPFAKNMAG